MLAVGPAANLDAHRDGYGPDHGLDNPPDGRRVGQNAPAFAAFQQAPDGALKIEIDDIESELLDNPGGGGHGDWVGAADLARPRGLGRRGAERSGARRSPRAASRHRRVRCTSGLLQSGFISRRKQALLCSSSAACVIGCETRTGPIFMVLAISSLVVQASPLAQCSRDGRTTMQSYCWTAAWNRTNWPALRNTSLGRLDATYRRRKMRQNLSRLQCWPSIRSYGRRSQRRLEASENPPRHHHRIGGVPQVVDQHRKLVPAETGRHVARPHAANQPPGNLAQRPIARQMAPTIINRLEAVQVDEATAKR